MRDELRGILDELAPRPPAAGLGLVQEPPQRPPLKERAALWDLAIKLGKELGSAIDAPPEAAAPSRPARPRRAAVDFG
jgi:hypothetical protein